MSGRDSESNPIVSFVRSQFALRNRLSAEYIPRHSESLARVCRKMAERFRQGGRLLAVGVGPYVTAAQRVSVEFVHPVIVGKRAFPALDLSVAPRPMLRALAGETTSSWRSLRRRATSGLVSCCVKRRRAAPWSAHGRGDWETMSCGRPPTIRSSTRS